jgi:hypothetical protein
MLKSAAKRHGFPLEALAGASQSKAIDDRRLLEAFKQTPGQSQLQPVFTRQPSPLPCQNRSVDKRSPTTGARPTLKQSGMSLNSQTIPGGGAQPQSHHSTLSLFTGLQSMARFLGQKSHKTALLIIELKGSVGCVKPLPVVAMAIEPGATPTARPAAQQTICKRLVSRGGVTHGPTLRRPAARSSASQASYGVGSSSFNCSTDSFWN